MHSAAVSRPPQPSPSRSEELFGQSDENADGVVSFDEFAKLMGSTGLFDLTG